MKHKHEIIEIIELYTRDKPTKIKIAKCRDCDTAFPELIDLLQERYDKQFELFGGACVVIVDPSIDWIEEKNIIHAKNPRLAS